MALVSDIQLQSGTVKPTNLDTSQKFAAEGLTATTAFAVTDGGAGTTVTPLGLITAQSENNISAYFNTTKANGDVNLYLNNDENPYWNLKLSATAGTADSFMIANSCGTITDGGDDDGEACEYPAFSISPVGAVGIGKTGANSILDVAYANSTTGGLILTETTNTVVTKIISCASCSVMGTTSNHPLEIITNNTAVASVDAAGCVGIGTDDPCELLHVQGNACITGNITSPGNFTAANIIATDDVCVCDDLCFDGVGGVINFNSGAVTITQTSADCVKMAGADLDLDGWNLSAVGTISADSITPDGAANPKITFTAGTTMAVTLGTDAGDDFTIGSTMFVVEGDTGNVGIGTAAPGYTFHVLSTTDGDYAAKIANSDADNGNGLFITAADDANTIALRVMDYSGATDFLTVRGSGNVGIGTAAPNQHLTIEDTSSDPTLLIKAADAGNSRIQFGDQSSEAVGMIDYDHGAAAAMQFTSGGSVRVTFDQNGNVGIGTATPQTALDLGNGTGGKSISWGGAGTNWYTTIGSTYGAGDLALLSSLKLSTTADLIQYSFTGTSAQSGTRFDFSTGDIYFFNQACASRTAGDTFDWGANTKMFICNNGNVGIGTDAPDGTLHVFTACAGSISAKSWADDLVIENSTNGGMSFLVPDASAAYTIWGSCSDDDFMQMIVAYNAGTPYWALCDNDAGNYLFYSEGKLGIGTSAPEGQLHIYCADTSVAPSANGNNFVIEGTLITGMSILSTAVSLIYFGDTADNDYMYIQAAYNSGDPYWMVCDSVDSKKMCFQGGNLCVSGNVNKAGGTFTIEHPLECKKDTHDLVHSFIEGPQADLIYSGIIQLNGGTAIVNVDTEAGMTAGTFVALNRCARVFTSNESNWDAVRGSITGNTLTIESNVEASTACISWMVVGERCDNHMMNTKITDDNGRIIVEPECVIEEE